MRLIPGATVHLHLHPAGRHGFFAEFATDLAPAAGVLAAEAPAGGRGPGQ